MLVAFLTDIITIIILIITLLLSSVPQEQRLAPLCECRFVLMTQ